MKLSHPAVFVGERPPGMFRSWRVMVTAMAALSLVACRDEVAPTLTGAAAHASRGTETNPDSSKWNRFEADVIVTVEGGSLGAREDIPVSQGASYRLIREKDAAGRWTTEHQFDDLTPRSSSGSRAGPPAISRVVTAPGSAPVFYDAAGRRVAMPSAPAIEMPSLAGNVQPPKSAALPMIQKTAPGAPAVDDTSADWLDRFMVTPASAQRRRDKLMRENGPPKRGIPGHSRFTRGHGIRRAELEVNDSSGTVDVVRFVAGGVKLQEGVRSYERRPDGVWVLASERTSHFDAQGRKRPQTVVVKYQNIKVLEGR
jgi:hypothetical protein